MRLLEKGLFQDLITLWAGLWFKCKDRIDLCNTGELLLCGHEEVLSSLMHYQKVRAYPFLLTFKSLVHLSVFRPRILQSCFWFLTLNQFLYNIHYCTKKGFQVLYLNIVILASIKIIPHFKELSAKHLTFINEPKSLTKFKSLGVI
jgi:hypothetical protein